MRKSSVRKQLPIFKGRQDNKPVKENNQSQSLESESSIFLKLLRDFHNFNQFDNSDNINQPDSKGFDQRL